MIRSMTAVVCGFVTYALAAVLLVEISGGLPGTWTGTAFTSFEIIYGAVMAALGGAITARVAPHSPLVHALALAGLILLASAASSLLFQGPETARWSFIGTIVVDAPAAVLGAYLTLDRRRYTS